MIFLLIVSLVFAPILTPIVFVMMVVLFFVTFFMLVFKSKKRSGDREKSASGGYEVFRYSNDHNEKEVKDLKNDKKTWVIIGAVFLILFPMFIPVAVIGLVVYLVVSKNKDNAGHKSRHGSSKYPHHEDECINCGSDFGGEVNEDCMFCGDGSNYDSSSENNSSSLNKEIDIEKAFTDIGRSVSHFAKTTKDNYENSAWKPRVDKASGWIKNELTIQDKDTDEEAYTYSGTYDDIKEEAEGLKVLLKAGIIEKDEYNDRMRELNSRK